MKVFAVIILAFVVILESLAFLVFHYPKTTTWYISNAVLVLLNLIGFVIAAKADPNDDKWKTYMPIIALIALIIEVVLPQATTFSI